MATRKKPRRRPAGRAKRKPVPGWLWLIAGLLIGLGLATFALLNGYIPQPKQQAKQSQPAPELGTPDNEAIVANPGSDPGPAADKPRYDFFTVLPEMEVVVPEQELREQARRDASSGSAGSYVLQVGSFQNPVDADGVKARLAMLGIVSKIQIVTVNDATWHRVRVGPYDSAREIERLKRQLQDNNIDSRVFRDQ